MRQMTEQMRQTERNQQGIMQTERAARTATHVRFVADPRNLEAMVKGRNGAPGISINEFYQYFYLVRAQLISSEDTFFQHQHNLLDDASFQSQLAGLRRTLSFPGFRVMWKRNRMHHEKSFRDFMDRLLSEVAVVSPASDEEVLEKWHRDVAAELATVRA
jgi:hypothetical protein